MKDELPVRQPSSLPTFAPSNRSTPDPAVRSPGPSEPAPDPRSPDPDIRNFYAWVCYQFFYRIGWQFKMESTLMAGLVTYFSESGRVMGTFNAVNTLARNLSPLVAAPLVDRFRHKRSALLVFWGLSTLTWAALTLYLWHPAARDRESGIYVFGACYSLFFVFLGAATVAQGALLGKIIPADRRGRALALGMTVSGFVNVGAILLIYQVVRSGAFPEPRNYALSFSLTTGLFLLAAGALLFIREVPSDDPVRRFSLAGNLRHFAHLAREHPNLRRLLVVNVSVGIGGSMLQFYTGFWRHAGTMTDAALLMATVFQVFWQCLSSSILGRVADRRGNRVVICSLMWVEVVIPLVALVLGGWSPFRERWEWYLGVYSLVGLRFPLYQLLVNYLLEVVPRREHAMALGAVNTIQLLGVPAAPLLGGVVDAWGYAPAFVVSSVVLAYGSVTALTLEEVREPAL